MTDDIAAFLQYLEIEEADVLGYRMGGGAARGAASTSSLVDPYE